MSYHFAPLTPTADETLTISVSLAGGSATGKTYSAFLLAKGLADGKKIAVLDTENKRALHYKADFPDMLHFDFGPEVGGEMVGFPPERWVAAINQIEAMDVGALVIDSFSHAWEGIGGVLELQAAAVERMAGNDARKADRVGQLAWAEVKPRYRRLIERIVQAKMHVVFCIRAKPVMQAGFGQDAKNARPTKIRREDIPWDIASDRDLIFEMTAAMILEPERPGQPVILKCPDHLRGLFPQGKRLSVDMGKGMRTWADEGGRDRGAKDLLDMAEAKAREGKEAFVAWWGGITKDERRIVKPKIDALQRIAEEADSVDDASPFTKEADPAPAQEDPAAAGRAAFAAGTALGDAPEHYSDAEADQWRDAWLAAERKAEGAQEDRRD